jgi:hypothetical protein
MSAPALLQSEWTRLDDVARLARDRGHAQSDTEARQQVADVVSRSRLYRAELGAGALLRFPERPPIAQDCIKANRGWIVKPILDITASTIVAPLRVPGTWSEKRSHPPAMQPIIVEMQQSDVDRIWPLRTRRGRATQYDWDEGQQFAWKLLRERGDPQDPLNHDVGWNSQECLVTAVVEHLGGRDGGPDPSTARLHVAEWLREYRASISADK